MAIVGSPKLSFDCLTASYCSGSSSLGSTGDPQASISFFASLYPARGQEKDGKGAPKCIFQLRCQLPMA